MRLSAVFILSVWPYFGTETGGRIHQSFGSISLTKWTFRIFELRL